MKLLRVFPRRTKATPEDSLAYYGPPDLFAQADAVHISVTFTADKRRAEHLAEMWRHVAPVTLGGVAYGDPGKEFVPGRYIKQGYTFTSRGCPRRCWFSVTGDTAIHTEHGWETIAQVQQRLRGSLALYAGGQFVIPAMFNEHVATPAGTGMATHLIDEGIRPVYEVRTRNGLTLRGTAEHPLLCVEGETLVWKPLGTLTATDTVVIRTPPVETQRLVTLGAPALRLASRQHQTTRHTTPTVLDADLAWLIGYILGDGCLPLDGRPAIHVCVVAAHEGKLRAILREKFAVGLKVYPHQKTTAIRHGWIYSRLVREFFIQSLGIHPTDKLRVPPCITQSPRAIIAAFLDGLWDADGYRPHASKISYLSTVSHPFAQQVALLLLSIGVVPSIHAVENAQVYKEGRCYRVGQRVVDTIPSTRGIYQSRKSGQWYWRTARSRRHGAVTRETLRRSGLTHPLDRPGWFYLPVAGVSYVGEERVYDLSVPGEEAFIANGFVAHNCSVWKRDPVPRVLPIQPGWNILDDNLLACPRPHVEAVFAMLRQQRRRVEFTGGLEALALEDYQVGLLADLRPRPTCFFAYDPGDHFETLQAAAARLLAAGFSAASHRLRCYVLIGFPKDTLEHADTRLRAILGLGFTPMAMLWQPETARAEKWQPGPEWRAFQRRWARPAIIHARKSCA